MTSVPVSLRLWRRRGERLQRAVNSHAYQRRGRLQCFPSQVCTRVFPLGHFPSIVWDRCSENRLLLLTLHLHLPQCFTAPDVHDVASVPCVPPSDLGWRQTAPPHPLFTCARAALSAVHQFWDIFTRTPPSSSCSSSSSLSCHNLGSSWFRFMMLQFYGT